ncbi:MAG: CTP synthase [Nanoarchaeota archaeon]|nr:CTP synthase [Nanoarchaeota archaeon]
MLNHRHGNGCRFIVVTGGVISGLGKGVTTASIAALLQAQGYKVTSIKIDPYINVDAGTMRPTEHGEVYVTYDGGETDQDLGTYERFLGVPMSKENSITTGQVYQTVIAKERNLEYDGKCVEVIPHIPQEVERRVKEVAKNTKADFVMIEVGGTSGDYQNVLFLDAFRRMHLAGDPVAFVHVVYLPIPGNLGEMKTKPAQLSVRMLYEVGVTPDFIVTRSSKPLDAPRREKIGTFCNVAPTRVISNPDLPTTYQVPDHLEEQGMTKELLTLFDLPYKPNRLAAWKTLVKKISNAKKPARIGIVGKYFDIGDFTLEDSYISVIEAIKTACWHNGAKPEIVWINAKDFEKDPKKLNSLDNLNGVIVPGGFGGSGVEGKIAAIQYCREHKIPYLGLCYGLQMAVIEFARHVAGLVGANTTEINPKTKHPVIIILPEQAKNVKAKHYGATMRLGNWTATLKPNTKVWQLYGKKTQVVERHRHRYEVNPDYISQLEQAGLVFSGASPDRKLMEYVELPDHPFFVATQAHPEFTSRALEPNPLFNGFVKACLSK